MGRGDLVPRIITGFRISLQYGHDERFKHASPVNLSETGVCIRFKLEVPLNARVNLLIDLGETGGTHNVIGKVAWVRHDEDRHDYYYGIGFVGLNEDQLQRIRKYVDKGSGALLQFLSEFPLFADFSLNDCRSLLQIVTLRELEKKQTLYRERTDDIDTQGLYVVQSGLLSVLTGTIPRIERQIAVISPGQIFGETTLLIDQPHTATIRAVNDSRLIQINKTGFQILKQTEPAVALKIIEVVAKALANRLGRTTKKLFSPVPV